MLINITIFLFLLQDKAVDSEQITDDEWRLPKRALTGFARLDARYFMPFFTFTKPVARVGFLVKSVQSKSAIIQLVLILHLFFFFRI